MKVYLITERVKEDPWDEVDVEDLNYKVLKTFSTYDLAKKYVERYIDEYFSEEEGDYSIETCESATYITDEVNDDVILVSIQEQEVITSEEDF